MPNGRAPASPPPDQGPSGTPHRTDRAIVLIIVVWTIAITPIVSILTTPVQVTTQTAAITIDPNLAPWWELTALPRIGEKIAREVTAQRQKDKDQSNQRPAFNTPTDLQRVRGIGQKTIRRIAPFLHFPPIIPSEDNRTPQIPSQSPS